MTWGDLVFFRAILTRLGTDLYVINLGIQGPFPPGCIAAIWGREFERSTSAWTAESTYVYTPTTSPSVRERMIEWRSRKGNGGLRRVAGRSCESAGGGREDEELQQGSEGERGDGKGKDSSQAPSLGRGGKRKRSG